MGIPWKDKGEDFTGCDCMGLVKLFFRETLDDPDCTQTKWTRVLNPQSFDAVAFNRYVELPHGGCELAPLHVGVLLMPTMVLHVDKFRKSGLDRIDNQSLGSMIEGFYRHPKMKA